MLGLQGSTSSPKIYRCVACSATFGGLASLLVHQAMHANPDPKGPSPQEPGPHPHEALFKSQPAPLPESPASSFYICDCGEEFHEFSLMLEHKRSHVSQNEQLELQDNNNVLSSGTSCGEDFPTKHESSSPTVSEPGLALERPSTSRSPAVQSPTSRGEIPDVSLGEGVAIVTTSQGQCLPNQEDGESQLNMSPTAEENLESEEDGFIHDELNSEPSSEKDLNVSKTNPIMKLIASAYMNRVSPVHSKSTNTNFVIPKQEVDPFDITPVAKSVANPVVSPKDPTVAQLRRLLSRPDIKTKAPSISRIIESSKKKVVPLTQSLSPVILLETRQKLMDPIGNGMYGRYQCGRCRRVFQHVDKLTEHHFLHKKERIKCCRYCKQLIIGRVPLPDNHTCPQLRSRPVQHQRKLSLAHKTGPFHGVGGPKKVYFCPVCKHSYARRWNLRMHKCPGPVSSRQTTQKNRMLKANSAASDFINTVVVGSDAAGHIKVESMSPNHSAQLGWNHPKNFPPFYSKSLMMGEDNDAFVSGISPQQDEENSWDEAVAAVGLLGEGQWPMPLNDEMHMLSSGEMADDGGEVNTSAVMMSDGLHYIVKDGVKWYPCSRCHKTYSQASTLRRHLRLCAFRPQAPGMQGLKPLSAENLKLFPCFVCGRNFNRRDNMMSHSKRCQQRSLTEGNRETVPQQAPPSISANGQTQEEDGGSWGIMSLPSVLPRRVTCECGVGFTSPKLLLDHLQKHAQESYTCPTCGETVNSWADYEVHLQIHMHPHHQLLKGIQPSQPLLLRFQQPPPLPPPPPRQQSPPSPSVLQPSQEQPRLQHLSYPFKKKQRFACTRCANTFSSRCSLRRHISWNRCKGARVANVPASIPKTYHCSHCNSDFPNSISLAFHQRSGACKPNTKPARCPICLRWFSTVEGLQKHMVTHKRAEYQCDICQGTYANIKSLKTHRRKIHRIMARHPSPETQDELPSELDL